MLEALLAWSDLTYILYKRVTQTYTLQTDNRTKDENLMELEIIAAIKVTYTIDKRTSTTSAMAPKATL